MTIYLSKDLEQIVVSSDKDLNGAAVSEGLIVEDPNSYP